MRKVGEELLAIRKKDRYLILVKEENGDVGAI